MKRTGMPILKVASSILLAIGLAIAVLLAWYWSRYPYLAASPVPWSVERIGTQLLIADVAGEHGYSNICCPAVLEVPDWVQV